MNPKILAILSIAAILATGCSTSSSHVVKTSLQADARVQEPDDPANDTGINNEEWTVKDQLIRGKPWGSENESEEQLLKNVKEAEFKPGTDLVDALNDLAGWYRGQKRYEEALNTYKRLQQVVAKQTGDPNKLENTYPLNNIAVVYTESKKFNEAQKAFKECLAIHEKDTNPINDEGEAETRHNYAELLWGELHNDEAKRQNDLAYDLLRKRTETLELAPKH